MSVELILAFNLALLAAIASPGPAFLLMVRTSLVNGRMAGVRLGVGLGFMASMWTLAALLGLESLFRLFPWAYTTIKIIGAGYLLYIAFNTWRGARSPIDITPKPASRDILDGILLNFSNPKSVLFAAAVLVVIFPPDLAPAAKALIVFNHFFVEVISYSLMAFLLSTKSMSARYLAAKSTLDRFAAVVMGGLGLRLLLQK